MSFKETNSYVLIFDTNILHNTADKSCNFCEFKLNKLFQNVINLIEERDLTQYIEIAIPQVVWNELFFRRVKSYNEKNLELRKLMNKFVFPNFEYELNELDYEIFIKEKMNIFKMKLCNYSIKINEIGLPSSTRFDSIINRAFRKKPPFEGIDKNSDKGFKDALIWESILEYKAVNLEKQICLYSRDGLFNDVLATEYQNLYNEKIDLLNSEENVIKYIAGIEKNINDFKNPKIDEIALYDEIRSFFTKQTITTILNEIGVNYKVGTNIYDLSNVGNFSTRAIFEVTDDENSNSLDFQAVFDLDLTFSNVDTNEELIILINYLVGEKSYYITTIQIMNDAYEDADIRIGGV